MLIQELIVGDLIKDYGFKLEEVFEMGFYEAHRLWMISDEIRFRDIQHQSITLDYVYSSEDKRKEFLNWIQEKQPRRYAKQEIPEDVLRKFAEEFNNG